MPATGLGEILGRKKNVYIILVKRKYNGSFTKESLSEKKNIIKTIVKYVNTKFPKGLERKIQATIKIAEAELHE